MTDRPPNVVWVRTRNAGSRKTYHTSPTCWRLKPTTSKGRVKPSSLLNATLSGRVLCAYCDGWHRGKGKRG